MKVKRKVQRKKQQKEKDSNVSVESDYCDNEKYPLQFTPGDIMKHITT